MERKLASVQRIISVEPIENADAIETVRVLGWQCVAKKGDFNKGDLCVYTEVDSVLPEREEFSFMAPRKYRVKTIKLRGQLSQGIAFPIKDLNLNISYLQEGDDLTKQLGITKYDPYFEESSKTRIARDVKGVRPMFVPKTDEFRIQSYPKLLEEMSGLDVYQSVKLDGSSMSVYYNERIDEPFGVCSRNLNLKETEDNAFWKVARQYELRNKLCNSSMKNIVFQGELCGPGIQKNKLGLCELDMFVFNVIFLDEGRYAGYDELVSVCRRFGLQTVPIEDSYVFNHTLEDLMEKAKGKYKGTKNHREGIVIRPKEARFSASMGYSLLSFKVLNNDFLLREE